MLHFVSEINIATVTLIENVGVIFCPENRIRKPSYDNLYIRRQRSSGATEPKKTAG